MAYTKQTWACGDEITAEKLNHIEDGIAEGGSGKFVVTIDNDTADHTFAEIKQAYDNGMVIEVVELVSGIDYVYQLLAIDSSAVSFSNVFTDGSDVEVTQFTIDDTGTVTKSFVTLTA